MLDAGLGGLWIMKTVMLSMLKDLGLKDSLVGRGSSRDGPKQHSSFTNAECVTYAQALSQAQEIQ